jgi:hypothetical protein
MQVNLCAICSCDISRVNAKEAKDSLLVLACGHHEMRTQDEQHQDVKTLKRRTKKKRTRKKNFNYPIPHLSVETQPICKSDQALA